jgi:hypothetical protein
MNEATGSADDSTIETKATPQELLRDLRAGRLEAAYELLGRQAPIRTWQEALATLSQDAACADLELAAHRALRRPPTVVASLLTLAEAANTPQAAFVARAITTLREERELVTKAAATRAAILERHELELALAGDDGHAALYLVLARDLPDQVEEIARVRNEAASMVLITRALTLEYQRLLELGRTVRWKSGSYRYFLRHSLADLALIGEFRGRTGELAYRLLQQQVDNPEENEQLIGLLPAKTRHEFFRWALERENANQHPGRTGFVLQIARRFPHDVDRRAVVAAAETRNPEVAVEALMTAVSLAPERADLDSEIADQIDQLDEPLARRLVTNIATLEPRRLRLELISPERRKLIIDAAAERPADFAAQIAALIGRVTDPEHAERLIDLAKELAEVHSLATESSEQVATAIANRAIEEPRWQPVLERAITGPRLRHATWQILPELPIQNHVSVYRALLDASAPAERAAGTKRLIARVDLTHDPLLAEITERSLDGTIELDALSELSENALQALASKAHASVAQMEAELERSRRLVARGQTVAEQDLREELQPIIERAIERAAGNQRLQDDYRRLLPGESGQQPDEPEPIELSPDARAELERVGARVEARNGTVTIELPPGDTELMRSQLRYLALLDQRLTSATTPSPETVPLIDAYIDALGKRGDAGELMTDLFERGPSLKIALALSAETRTKLVHTALDNGLPIPDTWYDDAGLGDWLQTVTTRESLGHIGTRATANTPLDLLARARRLRADVDAAHARTAQLLQEAKHAFLAENTSVFDDLERTVDGYVQLWQALSRLGISQVAALGAVIEREHIDPYRHEIVGDDHRERFVVRGAGMTIDQEIVTKARLEGINH